MMATNRRSARGAAIVLAMLLAALAAVVAGTVLAAQQRWSRNVEHRRDQVQAQALAMAGLQWARQILDDDARSSAIDHLGEPWALTLPPIPLDNGEIRGAIADAQSRLNLNALGDDGASAAVERARLGRLFVALRVPASALDGIADWIDRDNVPRAAGAEDGWYRTAGVGVLPANTPIVRAAEIAPIRDVAPAALIALRGFVTALPVHTAVNVNTAPREVLAALMDGISRDALDALVATRAQKPFTTVAEFRARLPEGARLPSEDALDVKSRYFEVSVEARQGHSIARARALVRREADHWPAVMWQVVE